MSTLKEQITQLERAMAALEAQRATLGDVTVEVALAPMREKLAILAQTETPTVWPAVGRRWKADNFLRVGLWRQRVRWEDEAYDRLVEQARHVTDQKERMKLYEQTDRILVEEAVMLPLSYGRWRLLVKPWISKFPTSAIRGPSWKDIVIEQH